MTWPGEAWRWPPPWVDLRAAARAYAVLHGESPARLMGTSTGWPGQPAWAVTPGWCLTLQPATGEVCYANAGGCPPLLVDGDGSRLLEGPAGPPLGAGAAVRREGTLRLDADTTMLLFTHGLVESRSVARNIGMERLLLAAAEAPNHLDDLCQHVVDTCICRLRRDHDICLVGLRLVPEAATAVPRRGPRG